MAIMDRRLAGATGSFGLETGHAMAAKSWRELQRCKNAKTSADRQDAAINCAITSWHMIEWIWAGLKLGGINKQEVLNLLGVNGRKATFDDFRDWAIRTCPELEVCQAICNGSKHVYCTGVMTEMGEPDQRALDGRRPLVAQAMIRDGAVESNAIDLLEKVVDFWTHHAAREPVIM